MAKGSLPKDLIGILIETCPKCKDGKTDNPEWVKWIKKRIEAELSGSEAPPVPTDIQLTINCEFCDGTGYLMQEQAHVFLTIIEKMYGLKRLFPPTKE